VSHFCYSSFREHQAERSVSEVSALLHRCSRRGWTPECSLEIAAFSDQYGDGIAALTWTREARRPLR